MNYIILTGAWVIYLTLHSILASNYIKGKAEKVGIRGSNYRLLYSMVSTIGIAILGWYMINLPGRVLFNILLLKIFGGLLLIAGLIILWLSFKYLSGLEFVGLKRADSEKHLVTSGIHSRLRHPIYTGTILILVGYFLNAPTDTLLISSIVILVYLPIGIYFEEKKLILKFGKEYLEYKQRVPALIPKF
ncbi:MAG: methyltransferase family protein [Bacteroidota bacterium]